MNKVSWEKIKAEYITTNTSYRLLAKKYDVSFSSIAQKARKEGWIASKKRYCENIAKKVIQKSTNREVNLLEKELALANKISDVLEEALRDAEQFHRYIVDGNGSGEKIYQKVDMNALKSAAETLKIVESLKRSMQSILTEPERMRFELEKRRIDLQERLAERDHDEKEEEGGVIFIPDQVEDKSTEAVYEDLTTGSEGGANE